MQNPRSTAVLLASCAVGLGFAVSPALANDDHHRARANLSGYNEVHFIAGNPLVTPVVPPALRGAISTTGRGTFRATIDQSGQSISYRLTYRDLEGDITQAHIHFGQTHTVGGIVVWLCQTVAAPGPAGTPVCPAGRSGTVEGTITAAQVLGVVGQGIDAGQFGELVSAIRAGATYANVHSALFPPGEIRGQIHD